MHIPRISERDDTLLHQIPQILDRRTGTTTTSRTPRPNDPRPDRRKELTRRGRVGVHTLCIPIAHGGCSCHGRSPSCGDRARLLCLRLLLWLLLRVEDGERGEGGSGRARRAGRRYGAR